MLHLLLVDRSNNFEIFKSFEFLSFNDFIVNKFFNVG